MQFLVQTSRFRINIGVYHPRWRDDACIPVCVLSSTYMENMNSKWGTEIVKELPALSESRKGHKNLSRLGRKT